MKTLLCRFSVLVAFLAPFTARAHPGHDDPDFTWDFDHLVEHPFATFFCFAVVAIGAWAAWKFARRSTPSTRSAQRRHR